MSSPCSTPSEVKKTNWCGLSMGGMVGQWLGANAPDRIEKLILSNTNSHYADKGPWNDRVKFVRENGLEKLVDPNMERWFTAGFRQKSPDVITRMKALFMTTSPEGYIACCEAIRDMDFRDSNARVTAPTLVIVGAQDPATPPAQGELIAAADQRRQTGHAWTRRIFRTWSTPNLCRDRSELPHALTRRPP